MQSSDIRKRFLEYFERNGHTRLASSSLVPADDPTLLFTNAGMVQFKRVFLGSEEPPVASRRATTAQKCVRAGGKHNDLEQVGHTARHHTFFEMLGNFSFGDYFKRDAIAFAWEFVTKELGIPSDHIRVTVFREDDEARALWRDISGLPDARIYGLGEKDNFWQMADTGPCGPCSEIYVDLANVARDWTPPVDSTWPWTSRDAVDLSTDDFVDAAEAGRFVEIWNLVFMQYDRQADGTLVPLPKPSVDTGAGLERIAAVLQGFANNFDTDVFAPMIATASNSANVKEVNGAFEPSANAGRAVRHSDPKYASDKTPPGGGMPASEIRTALRVLADHARAVAFLLADGVYPANDGRGYVLRRVLRRAVRYAWLLGKRDPMLVEVVATVIDTMGDAYPELRERRDHIVTTTRSEEERFLATIEGGMRRFDELAPAHTTQERNISGEDAFKLYDTYGFPIDLTELMARERGYTVDIPGFERSLATQRSQSQEERKSRKLGMDVDELSSADAWSSQGDLSDAIRASSFVGYDTLLSDTEAVAVRSLSDGRVAVILRESPFYAESGGQISDAGTVIGDGWRVEVDDVRKLEGKSVAIGKASGEVRPGRAQASVPFETRLDTQRNHTATHLLHAALRTVLGDHVRQAGSLVAPDRLRFDFTHTGPLTRDQIRRVEQIVNDAVIAAIPVTTTVRPYADAVASGAMALFGEKYGDVVRVVDIEAVSTELCGGTHVRNTAGIGTFEIVSESGIAAGVRRIEAITGGRAYEAARARRETLESIAELVKATPATAAKRVGALVEERRSLERKLSEMMRGGGGPVQELLDRARTVGEVRVVAARMDGSDAKAMQEVAEAVTGKAADAVVLLVSRVDESRNAIVAASGATAQARGIRADVMVRTITTETGGRGGGKPGFAQGGIPDASLLDGIVERADRLVSQLTV